MRFCLLVLLPVCLLGLGCRTSQTMAADIAPDVNCWSARTPTVESVRTYAAELERLNPGQRAPFDANDGLTLEEAEAVALLFNAELRAARLKAQVPVLGARQAGVADDPRLQFDFLRIIQGVATPWVLLGAIDFTIPVSGRLSRERAEALAQASAALRAAHLAEWSLVVRLREAWNVWSATGERIALIEQHLESVREILEIARAQREAEQIGATQVRVLELEDVTRAGELEALRLKRQRQALGLKALLGLTPGAEVTLLPEFSPDPTYLAWDAEADQLRRVNLELALAKAEFIVAHRALGHEVSKRFPDLELRPLFESEEGIDRLGAGVGIPIPLWNKNRRAIAEACAARAAARAAYQARFQELVASLAQSRAECQATSSRSAWLRDRVAPLADSQLADLRRLGELGDVNVLILKDALTTVLGTKFQLLDARLERSLASNRRRALVEPLRTPTTESIPE